MNDSTMVHNSLRCWYCGSLRQSMKIPCPSCEQGRYKTNWKLIYRPVGRLLFWMIFFTSDFFNLDLSSIKNAFTSFLRLIKGEFTIPMLINFLVLTVLFAVTALFITWVFYSRPKELLHEPSSDASPVLTYDADTAFNYAEIGYLFSFFCMFFSLVPVVMLKHMPLLKMVTQSWFTSILTSLFCISLLLLIYYMIRYVKKVTFFQVRVASNGLHLRIGKTTTLWPWANISVKNISTSLVTLKYKGMSLKIYANKLIKAPLTEEQLLIPTAPLHELIRNLKKKKSKQKSEDNAPAHSDAEQNPLAVEFVRCLEKNISEEWDKTVTRSPFNQLLLLMFIFPIPFLIGIFLLKKKVSIELLSACLLAFSGFILFFLAIFLMSKRRKKKILELKAQSSDLISLEKKTQQHDVARFTSNEVILLVLGELLVTAGFILFIRFFSSSEEIFYNMSILLLSLTGLTIFMFIFMFIKQRKKKEEHHS